MSTALGRLALSLALVAGLLVAGHWLRSRLGIALDIDSLRAMTTAMGPIAPLVFVFIVAARALLWLPSQVVLIVAGLCFGTGVGALVGGAGLMISGLFLFLVSRYAGRESIERRVGARGQALLDFTSRRHGAVALALASGYPLSPLSPLQAGAGLSAMPLASFVSAAFVGGTVRASTYAFFGDAMLELEGSQIAGAVGLLVAVLLLPLASSGGRRWLADLFARTEEKPPVD